MTSTLAPLPIPIPPNHVQQSTPYTASKKTVRRDLPTPEVLIKHLPLASNSDCFNTVHSLRRSVSNILHGNDKRLLVIVGECAIHDVSATTEFAEKLDPIAKEVSSTIQVVMRVYPEKPRTSPAWTGFVNDPKQDNSCDLFTGIFQTRELMLDILKLNLGIATEVLDPTIVPFFEDLVSWSCIGARTAISQPHRQLAACLPSPTGIKNPLDGSIADAINAILVARAKTVKIEANNNALQEVEYSGNQDAHLILRGGLEPNYDRKTINEAAIQLEKNNISTGIIVDCSHGNSKKKHENQPTVFTNVMRQRILGGSNIIKGVMLEASLVSGKQSITIPMTDRRYGQSITDECINFETTQELLLKAHRVLEKINRR